MTLLLFAAAGFAAAFFRGRRSGGMCLSGLAEIRAVWLPVAAALLHAAFSLAPSFARNCPGVLTAAYTAAVLLFLFFNRRARLAAGLSAAGTLCNFAVIALNGFRMPVSPAALSMYPGLTAAEVAARKPNYFIAAEGTRLYALADIIPLPLGKLGGYVSAGDLLLGAGVMLFVLHFLAPRPCPAKKGDVRHGS
jgi:hypothetical protein